MQRIIRPMLAAAIAAVLALPAQAHFVWVEIVTADGGTARVQVAFSEAGEPGAAYLVDRIAHAEATLFAEDGQPLKLELTPDTNDETGVLSSKISNGIARPGETSIGETSIVRVACKYGVFSRGETPGLLHYYAKYARLTKDSVDSHPQSTGENTQAQSTGETLALEIIPRWQGGAVTLTVNWNSAALEESEVVIINPAGETSTATTNAAGMVTVENAATGTYRIRANTTVDQSGTEDGQSYENELHYSTLTLDVAPAEGSAKTADAPTAAQLLAAARDARAVWDNFPGFTADIVLYEAGQRQEGTLEVDDYGIVTLAGLELGEDSQVERTLRSLVSHRMGNGEASDEVSYPDDDASHPLGRLVRLDYDSQMASSYRIRGDVITQVNRTMGPGRFTITVFDVHRNAEGKYMPATYAMHMWDADGALTGSTVVRETWVRLGDYELPATHAAVSAGAERQDDVRIEFRNHRLMKE